MRFIGNKARLLVYMHEILKSHDALVGDRFFDFFAGTGNVGKYFKELGYHVTASDILYFSYVLQEAYIGNTGEPRFRKLLEHLADQPEVPKRLAQGASGGYEAVIGYLNSLPGVEGFIYNNYTPEGTAAQRYVRMFFTGENGKRIDAVRQAIEDWRERKLINNHEYFVLLASVVESVPFYANISGVYAAYLKSYDPRAKKRFRLRAIDLSSKGPVGKAYCRNSMELLEKIDTDILYLDPPYNARQYAPNYHLLETIARYDNPVIKGVAGIRPYAEQRSEFCNPVTAIKALSEIAARAKYKVLVLSYNSEGIMPQKAIMDALSDRGEVQLYEVDYRRYKSNSKGEAHTSKKTHIQEQLYVLRPRHL